jgi:hypothetical protein
MMRGELYDENYNRKQYIGVEVTYGIESEMVKAGSAARRGQSTRLR